jgi:hypothetical protein
MIVWQEYIVLLSLLCVGTSSDEAARCVARCQVEAVNTEGSHSPCLDCIPSRLVANALTSWHWVKDDCLPGTVSINLHVFENAHGKCSRYNVPSSSYGKNYAGKPHERQHSPEGAVQLGERLWRVSHQHLPPTIFHSASSTQYLPPSITLHRDIAPRPIIIFGTTLHCYQTH